MIGALGPDGDGAAGRPPPAGAWRRVAVALPQSADAGVAFAFSCWLV